MDLHFAVILAVIGLWKGVKEVNLQAVDSSRCRADLDCLSTPNAVCLPDQDGNLRCVCSSGHFNESGSCKPRTLGDVCAVHSDCSDAMSFTFCPKRIRKCRCAAGYKRSKDTCIPLEIGDRCRRKNDCHTVIRNSVCSKRRDNVTSRVCLCEENYFPKLSGGKMACEYNKKIGNECRTIDECQKIGLNIECQGGKCVCQIGYKPLGPNSCTYRVLNDVCSNQEDCGHIGFGLCRSISDTTDSKCLCITGYRGENDGLDCSPRQINDTCDSDTDCAMPDSFCNENKVCNCRTGYKPSEHLFTCERQPIAEVFCNVDKICTELFNDTTCDTQAGYCKCKNRYISSDDGFACFFRHLDDQCLNDDNCTYSVPNSYCHDESCRCRSHFTPSLDKMECDLQIIGGKNCSSNSTCLVLVGHSFCDVTDDSEGRCTCQIGYRVSEDFDLCQGVNLLDDCTSDEECLVTNSNSKCAPRHRVCQCSTGYALIPARSEGRKSFCQKRRIGRHQCQAEGDCKSVITNSHCQACEKDSQVPGCRRACADQILGACVANTCQCNTGFYAVQGGQFCKGRQLWEKCTLDEDCSGHVVDAHCRRGTCYCVTGFRPSGLTTCVKRILGDDCYLDSDCSHAVNNSKCVKLSDTPGTNSRFSNAIGSCACVSGYVPHSDGTVCRKRQIGEKNCRVDTDCSDAVPDSYCRGDMCVCVPGFHPSANLYACTRRELYRHHCSLHRDCHAAVPNSECVSHLCVCKSGFAQDENNTCAARRIGDGFRCRIEKDCSDSVDNSTCNSRGYCACVTGYHPALEGSLCVRRRIGDNTCTDEIGCSTVVANSTCEDDTCVCVSGFYANPGRSSCIQRKIGDPCTNSTDCSDVIDNSECLNETCECMMEYDIYRNGSECFLIPQTIGSPCISSDQCQLIHNDSTCQVTEGQAGKCVCPTDTFVDSLEQECVPNPVQVGDRCERKVHCLVHLDNSKCDSRTLTCECDYAHFADDNGTLCHPWPKQLTDRCLKNFHCRKLLEDVECNSDNNTCVCQYGYTQISDTICSERPRLPAFKPYSIEPRSRKCNKDKKCLNNTNTECVQEFCECENRFAKRYFKKQCVAVQSYQISLHMVQMAGEYDFLPLVFKPEDKNFSQRVTLNGIKDLMRKSGMRKRYINSEILKIVDLGDVSNDTEAGLQVLALLHLAATPKYYHATSPKVIYRNILQQISQFHGELGTSRLVVGMPYSNAIQVTDFDECSDPNRNNCSPHATCINTVGSFMCVCKSDRIDVSHSENKLQGRKCAEPKTGDDGGDECSTSNCDARWLFVGLALTLVLLVVLSFIVYEIIQHKQSFNAKKLYEKFGTTKIRHLKKASWRRIQESKKKKKKKRKKSKKKSKEGSKSEEEGESSLLVLTPTTLNTEDVPPSPVEIIHTPAQPLEFPLPTSDDRGLSSQPFEDPETGLEFIDIDSPSTPSEPIQY